MKCHMLTWHAMMQVTIACISEAARRMSDSDAMSTAALLIAIVLGLATTHLVRAHPNISKHLNTS